jgi:hypothetical protein
LKRRRAFAQESDGIEVLFQHQGPTPYLPVELDYNTLPLDHRSHLDQVALFYGISAPQVHSLVYNYATGSSGVDIHRQFFKRPRITPAYPMTPLSSAHLPSRNGPDQASDHGLGPRGQSQGFHGSQAFEFDGTSRLANGLANLKVVLCHNCLTRCDEHESTSSTITVSPS